MTRQERAIVIIAEAFIRAHCKLEALSLEIGPDAACATPLNDYVIELHMQLERVVLGEEQVAGRRSN